MKNFRLLALLAILSIAAFSCKQNPGGDNNNVSPEMIDNNPATASDKVDKDHLPVMKFETDSHNFGKLTEGEIVTYSFKFTNTGKGPLIIANATASCGCTVPRYSEKPVQPGESGFIDVTFNSANKEGPMEKVVTVYANTIPAETRVNIYCEVERQGR